MPNRIKVITSLLTVTAIFCVMAAKTQTMLFAANNDDGATTVGKSVPGVMTLSPEVMTTMLDRAQRNEPIVEVTAANLSQEKNTPPQTQNERLDRPSARRTTSLTTPGQSQLVGRT